MQNEKWIRKTAAPAAGNPRPQFQILRAGTSIIANIEEAQSGQSREDFISKMNIALKEARETRVRLHILAEAAVIPEQKLSPLIGEADEIKRILASIIISARNNGLHRS